MGVCVYHCLRLGFDSVRKYLCALWKFRNALAPRKLFHSYAHYLIWFIPRSYSPLFCVACVRAQFSTIRRTLQGIMSV